MNTTFNPKDPVQKTRPEHPNTAYRPLETRISIVPLARPKQRGLPTYKEVNTR